MTPTDRGSPTVGAWGVLRQRNFGPYWLGNAASASGTWFQNLAASILVYRLTHSALMLGILNACQYGPVLLLSPWTGRAADAFDRRRLLLCTQSIAACLSASLAAVVWLGEAKAWIVIAFAGGLGVITAFSNPAQMALVGSLVPRRLLAQAVALNSMTFNVARAVGPAAAAGVIAAFGIAPAFAINSLSFLMLVGGLRVVSPTPVAPARRTSLRENVAMLRADPRLAGYLAVVMAVGMASDPVNTESPAIAHAFGYSPVWAGSVVGCFGVGAVLAAAATSGRIGRSRRRMAASLSVFGAGIALMAASPWLPLGLAFVLIGGFGYLSSNAAATTHLQLGVRDEQRGRIMALWSVAFLGTRPLSSLCDGAIAESAGIRVAAPIMAVPALLAAAVLLRKREPSSAELEPTRG
ncbi:MAG TPA: MFS transporter [Gaiellaceae bacterium]|nr:MFS transporter [Gaiellaceae bacterium]